MKRLLLSIATVILAVSAAQAQRLVIGERVPEMKITTWYNGTVPPLGKATLVDFFHTPNEQCVANLPRLNELQTAHNERLNVVVIAREGLDKVSPFLDGKGYRFYAGIDDAGKTFTAYGVRFVPFAALIDARGRLVWTGNVASLTNEIIEKAF